MGKLNLTGKRILVTGGNGYLGKHLVSALENEHADVFILDNQLASSGNSFNCDITDRIAVAKAVQTIQPEIIYHLAASLNRERTFDRFDTITKINHDGTYNLLLALKGISYHNFIFTSTSEIYGSNKPPFTEQQIPQPASPYSLTKLYAENLISNFSITYQKQFTILRLFNFFGNNMPANFFIPQMVEALKNEAQFKMTEGGQKRDFLFIDDVVQALILSAIDENGTNEIFNVCSGDSVSLKELALEIHNELNSRCDIQFGALPYRENEVWDMVGENKKIKDKLGFNVQNDFKKAIRKLVGNEL